MLLLAALMAAASVFACALPTQAPTGPPQSPQATGAAGPKSVTITAVGDLMMHQRQLTDAKQKDGSYDFSDYFTEVAPYLNKADLTFGNLETTLLGKNYRGYPLFSAPDSYLDAIKTAGFDVVTTANNHSFDTGFAGLVRTIDTLRAYGFYQTGTFKSAEEAKVPLIIDVRGVKVGVVAYTHGAGHSQSIPKDVRAFCLRVWKTADYERDVKACRDAGAQLVIACVHWGNEYARTPSNAVRAEAVEMLEAGVDLILGSHPHVVQPFEIIDVVRKDKTAARCAVAFSMGNFMSNQRRRYSDCGIIFNITLTQDASGKFQIASLGYVPTYVNRSPGYTGYRVLPVAEYMADAGRLSKLDPYNRANVRRAYSDLTLHLRSGPAELISSPNP
jgi:poly-gamma-glutamate synthesis protein (capsule biosynthesis protein)